MTKQIVLSAKIDYLQSYANTQFAVRKGLKLNSRDWEVYVDVKKKVFYNFLRNGTIFFSTKSSISGQTYEQPVKLKNFKQIESLLFILFICKVPDNQISEFLKVYMSAEDVNIRCSCEAFSKWGPHYNLTKINSIYGPGESRPPVVRDKVNINLVCKHLWVVLNDYVRQVSAFSVGLIPYYKRFFNVQSPTGAERIKRQMSNKQLKKLFEQSFVDLNKINNPELSKLYDELFKKYVNEMNEFAKETKANEDSNFDDEQVQNLIDNAGSADLVTEEEVAEDDIEDDEVQNLIDNAGALSAKRQARKNKLLGAKKFRAN